LNNVERNLELLDIDPQIKTDLRGSSKLSPTDPKQRKFREAYINKENPLYRSIYKIVCQKPEEFSAELNTILKFLRTWSPISAYLDELKIYLYPTDTDNCKFCANIIRDFIVNNREILVKYGLKPECGVECVIEELKGFGVSVEFFFKEGIDDLLNKYARVIKELKGSGYRVIIMPVGGYKPECTYATIVGLLFGADKVVYIHESFREIVELPLIPINIDSKFVDLIRRIGSREVTKSEIDEWDIDELVDRGLLCRSGEFYTVPDWIIKF